MRRRLILHPLCFAIFPVLSLFAANADELVLGRNVLLPAGASLLAAAVVWSLLRLAVRDWRRAGLMASALVLSYFSYGSVGSLTTPRVPEAYRLAWEQTWLPVLWGLALLMLVVALARTRRDLVPATSILNATALVLIALPLLQVGKVTVARARYWQAFAATPLGEHASRSLGVTWRPDIYYIILDRYACAGTLEKDFGFDNSPFIDALKRKGFYVAPESHSNYPKTLLSLASSLNLDYIDDLTQLVGRDSGDLAPASSRIQGHRVERMLREYGYESLHYGSWMGDTMLDVSADQNILCASRAVPQFTSILLGSTAALPSGVRVSATDPLYRQWAGTRAQFDMLAQVQRNNRPRFVFAHVLVPHEPYVFDRDGRFLSPDVVRSRPERENFVEQLRYTNRRVEQLVDALLADKRNPPVIILQADEGPYPERFEQDGSADWHTATDAELRMKTGILNAYYLPGAAPTGLYPTITPVNTFRLVFNRYLHTGLPLLPDRNYAFRNIEHVYDFFDITDRVRPAGAGEELRLAATRARPSKYRQPPRPGSLPRRLSRMKG